MAWRDRTGGGEFLSRLGVVLLGAASGCAGWVCVPETRCPPGGRVGAGRCGRPGLFRRISPPRVGRARPVSYWEWLVRGVRMASLTGEIAGARQIRRIDVAVSAVGVSAVSGVARSAAGGVGGCRRDAWRWAVRGAPAMVGAPDPGPAALARGGLVRWWRSRCPGRAG